MDEQAPQQKDDQSQTTFLKKATASSAKAANLSSPLEVWGYGLLNATLIGGASSVSSWLGMTAAHGLGLDVPMLNWESVCAIFVSGAAIKFFAYLSQGLPALKAQNGGN